MKSYFHHKLFQPDFLAIKSNFASQNYQLHNIEKVDAATLSTRPIRTNCIICDYPIDSLWLTGFKKNNIDYLVCPMCTHLQARFIADDAFQAYIFEQNDYTKTTYRRTSETAEGIRKRLTAIDKPKAEHILNEIKKYGLFTESPSILDIGCGSGYMIKTLLDLGISKIAGCDYSNEQLENANKLCPNIKLYNTNNTSIHELIHEISPDIAILMGSLEHFSAPRDLIRTIRNITSIKLIVISVPTYSFSTYIECVERDTWARQLSSSHTHLFTETSLDHLLKENDFDCVSTWFYGQDVLDLLRLLMFDSDSTPSYQSMIAESFTIEFLNDLQYVIDKHRLSSEIMSIYIRH